VVQFLARKKDFPPKHPDQLWDPPSLIPSCYWESFPHGYRVGNRADHLSPSCAEIKNEWYCIIPPFFLMVYAGANFTFYSKQHAFFSLKLYYWSSFYAMKTSEQLMCENHCSDCGTGIANSL
jgi:hypothetical protein